MVEQRGKIIPFPVGRVRRSEAALEADPVPLPVSIGLHPLDGGKVEPAEIDHAKVETIEQVPIVSDRERMLFDFFGRQAYLSLEKINNFDEKKNGRFKQGPVRRMVGRLSDVLSGLESDKEHEEKKLQEYRGAMDSMRNGDNKPAVDCLRRSIEADIRGISYFASNLRGLSELNLKKSNGIEIKINILARFDGAAAVLLRQELEKKVNK